ncbi:MAG: hypothetical protein GY861_15430, partial [bacterium]|nr:hypothetical protein [bacterium]
FFIICASGPILPDWEENPSGLKENWDKYFDTVVAGVKAGSIKSLDLYKARSGVICAGGPSGANCAYRR